MVGYAYICISGLYASRGYISFYLPLRRGIRLLTTPRGIVSRHPFLQGIWHPLSGVCVFMHPGTICISGLYLLACPPSREARLFIPLFQGDMPSYYRYRVDYMLSVGFLPHGRPGFLSPSFGGDTPPDYTLQVYVSWHPF